MEIETKCVGKSGQYRGGGFAHNLLIHIA